MRSRSVTGMRVRVSTTFLDPEEARRDDRDEANAKPLDVPLGSPAPPISLLLPHCWRDDLRGRRARDDARDLLRKPVEVQGGRVAQGGRDVDRRRYREVVSRHRSGELAGDGEEPPLDAADPPGCDEALEDVVDLDRRERPCPARREHVSRREDELSGSVERLHQVESMGAAVGLRERGHVSTTSS